jgi:hypothetical protein
MDECPKDFYDLIIDNDGSLNDEISLMAEMKEEGNPRVSSRKVSHSCFGEFRDGDGPSSA